MGTVLTSPEFLIVAGIAGLMLAVRAYLSRMLERGLRRLYLFVMYVADDFARVLLIDLANREFRLAAFAGKYPTIRHA
jgi:hypothetical protein